MAPAGATLVLLLFLPESPRFLAQRKQYAAARQVLERLRGTLAVEDEFRAILRGVHPEAAADCVASQLLASVGDDPLQASPALDSDCLLQETSPLLVASHSAGIDGAGARGPWWVPLRVLASDPTARRAMIMCIALEFFQQFSGTQAVTTVRAAARVRCAHSPAALGRSTRPPS